MIYVDANAIVYLLHDVKPKSDRVIDILSRSDQACTSLRTIEETSYILIRIYLGKHYGLKGIHRVREIINQQGLGFIIDELKAMRGLLSEYNIIVLQDRAEVSEIHEAMIKYSLLPGDAIIALTCRHYGIDAILTFDEDFKRVPWLKVVP